MRKGKFNARRTTVDNIVFASAKEAKRYSDLKLLERGGQIHSLQLQPEFPIWINGKKCFVYKADFSFMENDGRTIEDCKGFRTAIFRLKKKCVEAYYGITITET